MIYNRYIKWDEIDYLQYDINLNEHGFSEKTFTDPTNLVQSNSAIQLEDVLSILDTVDYDCCDVMQ